MASCENSSTTTTTREGEEEINRLAVELGKTLKPGERLLGPTRRPGGTLRKALKIKDGFTPQDEVAIYKSKGASWKKEMDSLDGPPGYDPEMESKSQSKSKAVKRNEREIKERAVISELIHCSAVGTSSDVSAQMPLIQVIVPRVMSLRPQLKDSSKVFSCCFLCVCFLVPFISNELMN